MDFTGINPDQLVWGAIAAIVVLFIAIFLWRILKRAIGGCISVGIGCLVLVLGLAIIALYFLSRYGVINLQGLFGSFGP
jgi:hypothetical protein